MKEEKYSFNLGAGVSEVVIRHGEAEKIADRESVEISGNIDTVQVHLKNPPEWLKEKPVNYPDAPIKNSFVSVSRDLMQIIFIEDAGMPWESTYKGRLELDKRFKKFEINTGKPWRPLELANFIKMNRSHFETRQKAMELVSILSNFEAKVDKEVEEKADQRANTKMLRQQTVTSNIPEKFNIKVPVFKGQDAVVLEIEIVINPIDLSCSLISPESNDYVEDHRDELMDAQIKAIEELFPNLRIFEV